MRFGKRVLSLALAMALLFSVFVMPAQADPGEPFSLNHTELNMLLGGELVLLEVANAPDGATITWASDDWRVVRASPNGYISSLSKGKANVTATISGDGIETTVLTCAVTVGTLPNLITNDTFHYDTDGNPIFAQMGSINMYNDGTGKYWWYGINQSSARRYWNSMKDTKGLLNSSAYNYGGTQTHISLYSSTNLVDWDFEGNVVTLGSGGTPSWTGISGWFGRLGVVYNEELGTYHMMGQGSTLSNGVWFASAPTPQGPWVYHGVPNNLRTDFGLVSTGTGDQTVFYDASTGNSYVIFGVNGMTSVGYTWNRNAATGNWASTPASSLGGANQSFWESMPERDETYIGILAEDYKSIDRIIKVYDAKEDDLYNLYREGGREANGMFKYGDYYYTFASGLRGWNTGPTFFLGGARNQAEFGTKLTNEVGLRNNMSPMRGSVTNNGHTSQVVGVIVSDTKTTADAPKGQMVLQMGDRWTNTAGYGVGFDTFNPLSMVSPSALDHPSARDIPRVPNPQVWAGMFDPSLFGEGQDLNVPGLRVPEIWSEMDTFYPFLPEGYEEKMNSSEWVKPQWDIPVFNNVSQFFWDIENGEWSVGPNNNYLDNDQFENDRVAGGRDVLINGEVNTLPVIQTYVNEPNGWKADHISGQVAQINWGGGGNSRASGTNVFRYQLGNPETINQTTGLPTQSWYSANAGNYAWYHGYSKRNEGTDPYKTRTSQLVEGLEDGTYTFYGWVRSSGGQNEAYMYIGDEKLDLTDEIDTWTLLAIEGVSVVGGSVEVGFYSDAAANQWMYLDDFALIRTGDIEDDYSDGKVRVKLSGPASLTLADEAEYIISVANANGLATVTLWIEVDGDFLNSIDAKGLIEGFGPIGGIAWTNPEGSTWVGRVTVGALEGEPLTTQEYVDLFKLNFGLRAEGDTAVTIKDIKLSGYDEAGTAVFFESLIKNGTVETEIGYPYSVYDLNKDRVVDQLDLTIAQKYYTAAEGDANWDAAKIADVNGSGNVDIEDFILILNNIVW